MVESIREMTITSPARSAPPGPVTVVAVTQDDPFFTGRFFESFLREAAGGRVQLLEIVLLRNFNESRMALLRRFWKLYGTADLIRLLARYAGALLSERFGRPRSVAALAARAGVPVRQIASINDETYLQTLRERHVDVLLSVSAPEIFRSAALQACPHAINIHNGKLPFYRGMMPTFWALLHGEPQVTITVHTMAEKLDAGSVLAEYAVPIGPDDTQFDLSARAKDVAGREVARLLARLGTPDWPTPVPVDMSQKRYFKFPTPADVAQLRERGRQML
ncbi:MAG TPA: formyltransferase family protein [Gemmatimonadales bacterium]|nr:formyltransferase family protein [Gemmatimonadales bacterium]